MRTIQYANYVHNICGFTLRSYVAFGNVVIGFQSHRALMWSVSKPPLGSTICLKCVGINYFLVSIWLYVAD